MLFFFFKQKTAYEMLISDWSSDVCSSDLLAHLDEGATAPVTLQHLLEEDPDRDHRQVGIVDMDGVAASHTGSACFDWAGGATGEGYAIQGNILTGPEVVEEMERSEEHTSELQSLMSISYAVFCLKKKNNMTITAFVNKVER